MAVVSLSANIPDTSQSRQWDVGRPFLLQDLLPPALLDLFTLWRRMGLMRNPSAGLFKGKGKNNTCPVSLGRRGLGSSTGKHRGGTPSFWGDTTCLSELSAKHPKSQLARCTAAEGDLRNSG